MSKKSKNPVSLLISELEEMSGGKVLFTERLEDPLPSSPTMDWLLSKEHILFSRPVGTLAFQVKLIRTTLLDVEQAWTSVFYLKSFDMDSVQVGKAVFGKEIYTTLGIEPRTYS